MPTVAEVLILLAAVAGSGGMVGFLGWLLYRVRRLEAGRGGGGEDVEQLAEQLDVLRAQLSAVRDEMGQLSERVEFAERLLTKGEPGDAARGGLPPR